MLTVVSLFAGVGGIDLAAERAGMRTVLLCEKDEPCRRVLAERFPDAVIHPDVTELTADDLRAAGAVPARTVLTAGWPCQGNSVAGRRGGMDDARSGLWVHVARLLAGFRPAWFVGENVPGLLSVNEGRDFATVVGDLAELRYGWAYRVLDARYFGVPQRRARVVIVGRAGNSGAAPAEVLFEPEGSGGDSAARSEAWPDVAPCLESGANRAGRTRPPGTTVDTAESLIVEQTHTHTHRWRAHGVERGPRVAGRRGRSSSGSARGWEVAALTANGVGTCGADDNQAQAGHLIAYAPDVAATLSRGSATGDGVSAPGRRQEDDHNLIVTALTTRAGATFDDQQIGQLVVGVLGEHSHTLTAEGADAGEDGTGRGTPIVHIGFGSFPTVSEDEAASLTRRNGDTGGCVAYPLAVRDRDAGGGKPGQGYPAITDGVIVRRLTPLECERLQGFPDNWTLIDSTSDSQRYRQMGNSVAVPVFEWVLSRLADASEAVA